MVAVNNSSFIETWEIVQKELNRLSNSSSCNAMAIYTAIYKISASKDPSFPVRLHWCIGKFFYAFASRLRSSLEADCWVEQYARAFAAYENTVEALDSLSSHLNDVISGNRECRRVKELGYVIWERCVLRHRYEKRLPTLYEALPSSREHIPVCLRSLRKIVPNPADALEYYTNNYEFGLLRNIITDFKHKIGTYTGTGLIPYLQRCSLTIEREKSRCMELFLPESHQKVAEEFERALFPRDLDSLEQEFAHVLARWNLGEIRALHEAVGRTRVLIFGVLLKALRAHCDVQWVPMPASGAIPWAALSETRRALHDSLESLNDSGLLAVLDDSFSSHLKVAGVGESLAEHMGSVISAGTKDFGALCSAVKSREERALFFRRYIALLVQRLLTLNFDIKREREAVKSLPGTAEFKRRATRIFEDLLRGARLNDLFHTGKSANERRFVYHTSQGLISFFTTVATACVWPISEEARPNLQVPAAISEWTREFEAEYKAAHPRRRLSWIWGLSSMQIELRTDKVYTLKMPLYHFVALERIREAPGLPEEAMSALIGVGASHLRSLIKTLLFYKVLRAHSQGYALNREFRSEHSRVVIEDVQESEQMREGNRRPYYQAWVSKALKQARAMSPADLESRARQAHTDVFSWDSGAFSEAVSTLLERGFIESFQDTYHYVP